MAKADDIIQELKSIRERIGAKPVDFSFERVRIDNDLASRSEVEALFHPSGFLMKGGMPVFVYIRDHTESGYLSPEQARKIHFYKCRTLQEKIRAKKFELRYRVTSRDDNRYLIDTERQKEKEVVLYPCQNCLERVSYQCFSWQTPLGEKEKIVRNFDAKVALALIGQQFEIFREDIARSGLSSASLPAGYSGSWRKISRELRRSRNYTCEQCGVQLKNAPQCVDTHHGDHDKQNNRYSNLVCLCKCCHAKLHGHYSPGSCKDYIDKEQKRQGCVRTCTEFN